MPTKMLTATSPVYEKENRFYFRFTAHIGLGLILYLYSITVGSAAPQATLWGGLGPRFKLGTGDLEARTLTTRPPL